MAGITALADAKIIMDPERRHELERSDLAAFFTGAGEWWQKYSQIIMIVVIVVLVGFMGYRLFRTSREVTHEEAWGDLAMTSSPDGFLAVAADHQDNPAVHALATLRAATLLLKKSIARPTGAGGTQGQPSASAESLTDEQKQRYLEQAARHFLAVLEVQGANGFIKLNAKLGLARVAESQGRWDDARRLYQEIEKEATDDAALSSSRIIAQAKTGLALLDRLAKPVIFSPEEPATSASEPDEVSPLSESLPIPDIDTIAPSGAQAPQTQPSKGTLSEKDDAEAPAADEADAPVPASAGPSAGADTTP